VETEHYFLDLPALAEALTEWLDAREEPGCGGPT
jgi:methionyl-tRNA synthetase